MPLPTTLQLNAISVLPQVKRHKGDIDQGKQTLSDDLSQTTACSSEPSSQGVSQENVAHGLDEGLQVHERPSPTIPKKSDQLSNNITSSRRQPNQTEDAFLSDENSSRNEWRKQNPYRTTRTRRGNPNENTWRHDMFFENNSENYDLSQRTSQKDEYCSKKDQLHPSHEGRKSKKRIPSPHSHYDARDEQSARSNGSGSDRRHLGSSHTRRGREDKDDNVSRASHHKIRSDKTTGKCHGTVKSSVETRTWNQIKTSKGEDRNANDPATDSDEEYRRSRSRERARRRKQAQTMSRVRPEYQLFWDGFQWIPKNMTSSEGNNKIMIDQMMAISKKERRLEIGNIPLGTTEDQVRIFLFNELQRYYPDTYSKIGATNPIVAVGLGLSPDPTVTEGFVELLTGQDALNLIRLDGIEWAGHAHAQNGAAIRIIRPPSFGEMLSRQWDVADSNPAHITASLAMAAEQAVATGNGAGLRRIVEKLPLNQQAAVRNVMAKALPAAIAGEIEPAKPKYERSQCSGQLSGSEIIATKVLRFERVSSAPESEEDLNDTAADFSEECSHFGDVVSVRIIRSADVSAVPFCTPGDIFVEFQIVAAAKNCYDGMSGRFFDGKKLVIRPFDERLYVCSVKSIKCPLLPTLGATDPKKLLCGAA